MKKFILAAAMVAAAGGTAIAQEPPYTVREGQVKYPGQMQWNAPAPGYYAGDIYYGGASAAVPDGYYVERPGYYMDGPRYQSDSYNQHGPGVYTFDDQNINADQNYSGR